MSTTNENVIQSGSAATESLIPEGQKMGMSDWKSSISEEYRGSESLAKFNDIDGLAKSYVSLEKTLGNSVRIPGEDAGAEDMDKFYSKLTAVKGVARIPGEDASKEVKDEFYSKLGRPLDPNGYKFNIDDSKIDKTALEGFKTYAHQLNLNNTQAQALVEYQLGLEQRMVDDHNSRVQESKALLTKKWGDDYTNRLHGAKAALEMYRDQFPDMIDEIEKSSAGINPVILTALSDLYGTMKEKGSLKGAASVAYGESVEEARSKIQEIRNNPYMMEARRNPMHPDHKDVTNKLEALYAKIK